MNIYDKKTMGETIKGNEYVGRGIVIGMTEDAKKAAIAYFIMGRSENSRNRVFREEDNSEVVIYPFDESKVEDPSLIIYSPIKKFENKTIVTNGDQTQTIYEFLEQGKCFHRALNTRCRAGQVLPQSAQHPLLRTGRPELDAPNLRYRLPR